MNKKLSYCIYAVVGVCILFLAYGMATRGGDLRSQLLGQTAMAIMPDISGIKLSIGLNSPPAVANPAMSPVTNPILFTSAAPTEGIVSSFTLKNQEMYPLTIRNVGFRLGESSVSLNNARLMLGGVSFGAVIPQVAVGTNILFSNSAGVVIQPGTTAVMNVVATPAFTGFRSPVLRLTSLSVEKSIAMNIAGQGVRVSAIQPRINFSRASDTPTSAIAAGATNVTLAKFVIYPEHADWRIRFLPVRLTVARNQVASAVSLDVKNIRIIDDTGAVIGSPVANPSGNWGSVDVFPNSYRADFGLPGSNLNYVIPANTTRVISIQADIQPQATVSGISAHLIAAPYVNMETTSGSQSGSSPRVSGNMLPIASGPIITPTSTVPTAAVFTTAINAQFTAPSYSLGATNTQVKIASFILSSSSTAGTAVTALKFDKDFNSQFDIRNMLIKVNGVDFGDTRDAVADAEVEMLFSAAIAPVLVTSAAPATVDVYADILGSSTPATHISVIDLTGGAARDMSTGAAIVWPQAVSGQNVTITPPATANPTVFLSTDSSYSPQSQNLVMGSEDNVVYAVRVRAGNEEDISLRRIVFTDTIEGNAAGIASLNNLSLYDANTNMLLAGPVNMDISAASPGKFAFSFSTSSIPLIMRGTGRSFVVRAGVATYLSYGAKSGSRHTIGVSAAGDVTATGVNSGAAAVVSGTPSGSAQSIYRTKLSLSVTASSTIGAATGRARLAVDDLARFTLSAHLAHDVRINRIKIRFSGQAVASSTTAFGVSLIDQNTNYNWGSSEPMTCTPAADGQCSVTFNPEFSLTRGSSKVIKLRVNSSLFNNVSNTSDSLSATIIASDDILWSDGTTNGISFEPVDMPIKLVDLSYE